jgi:hypothetical protein
LARTSRWAIVGSAASSARDLRHRQPRHQPQRQRHLRLDRQRRVAAGEDQPQPLVGDGVVVRALVVSVHLVLRPPGQLLRVPFQHPVAPQPVDRPVPRHRHDPRPWVVGHTVGRPAAQRGQVGILDRVLGESDVAEDAGKQRDGTPEL